MSACTVPLAEAREIVGLTKTIDESLTSLLALLSGEGIAEHLVRDLAEIASSSLYIRDQIEQALAKAEKKAEAAQTEVPS